MNDSDGPHAKQQRKPKSSNGEEINHKIDPELSFEAHLGKHSKRGDKQSNDDAKNIAESH